MNIQDALPVFDPAQTRLDGWVTRKMRSRLECEVVEIPFDKHRIELAGDPMYLVFKVTDRLKYQITTSKEFLVTASDFLSQMVAEKWFGNELEPIELAVPNQDVVYSKEHFVLLSDYINTGLSTEKEWTLADFKTLYELSNWLNIKSIRKRAEKGIVAKVDRDSELAVECLSFGVSRSSSHIIGPALKQLVSDYERSIQQPPSKQYLSNTLLLIKQGAAHLKDREVGDTIVAKAQKLFDDRLFKKRSAKFQRIFRDFEYQCSSSPLSVRPRLAKKLSKLKNLADLLKDEPEIEEKSRAAEQLFHDFTEREPSE
ncbi:MAG: hypothetical protein JSR37_05415 [Verrucomicrobia bacterium]|nr:hypothetical protein [Verrucomicrobiota bacterium]MBS0637602.1 hypothetical protein [Verrucomicrobiota bacterium]